MRYKGFLTVILMAAVMLLAACRSAKEAATEEKKAAGPQCVSAKADYNISVKNDRIQLSGNVRMKRDEVIRLQLVVMGLMEAARVELTPDSILVMDRINKQYAKAAYGDVELIRRSGHDFKSMQTLLWGMLDAPDNTASIITDDKKVKVDVKLLSPSFDCNWETHTVVSSRYRQVSPDELLKKLSSM